ncbi:hypothetical protein GW17_00052795, partial [Ensete ventricosum]
IQDKAKPWDHDPPTSNATRKSHIRTRRSWSLSLEDKADLKWAKIMEPQLGPDSKQPNRVMAKSG